MGTGKPSKYEPLRRYLLTQSGDRVTLTFAELEAIIGAPLPESARVAAWWANARNQHSAQMQAWWGAGWRVVAVRRWASDPSVMFERR